MMLWKTLFIRNLICLTQVLNIARSQSIYFKLSKGLFLSDSMLELWIFNRENTLLIKIIEVFSYSKMSGNCLYMIQLAFSWLSNSSIFSVVGMSSPAGKNIFSISKKIKVGSSNSQLAVFKSLPYRNSEFKPKNPLSSR